MAAKRVRSAAFKAYHKRYMRERYQNDPEHRARHRERTTRNDARYRAQVVELIAAFRSRGCMLCPENTAQCLTAHHLDPELKDFSIGVAIRLRFSARKVAAELAKCVCLCMNCHAKLHAGLIELPGVPVAVSKRAQLALFE